MLEYPCSCEANGKTINWRCTLAILDHTGPLVETEVTGKGSSFHLLVGPQENGHFACIPNWNIGCELASYSDTFWNREQLRELLNPIDAETVVMGIAQLAKYLPD